MKDNFLTITKIILILLFLGCLLPMEYEYFQFVRVVGMISFSVLAFDANSKKEKYWFVIWLLSAIAINPIIKIPLGRFYWNIIDIIWSVLLLVSIFISNQKIYSSSSNNNMKESGIDSDKKLMKFIAREFLILLITIFVSVLVYLVINHIEDGNFNYYFQELNPFTSQDLYKVVNTYTFLGTIIVFYFLRPLFFAILWSIKTLKD